MDTSSLTPVQNQQAPIPDQQQQPPPLLKEQYAKKYAEFKRGLANNVNLPRSAQEATITLNEVDFFYIVDQLIKYKNDNYILEQRVHVLENVVQWCLQFLTFVFSISNLLFNHNLPLAAVIFNSDLYTIPFSLLAYFRKRTETIKSNLTSFYGRISKCLPSFVAQTDLERHLLDTNDFPDLVDSAAKAAEEEAFFAKIEAIQTAYTQFAQAFDTEQAVFSNPLLDSLNSGSSPKKPLYKKRKLNNNDDDNDNNDADNDTTSSSERQFTSDDLDKRARFMADLKGLLHAHNIPLSPNFLLNQVFLADLLMQFATSVFTYVPQLMVDFSTPRNLSFSIRKFGEKLRDYWSAQANVCIGPFHLAYNNSNNTHQSSGGIGTHEQVVKTFRSLFSNTNEDFFEPITNVALCTYTNVNRRLVDPLNARLDYAWKQLFVENTLHATEHDQQLMFESLLKELNASTNTLFSKKLLSKCYALGYHVNNNYLSEIKHNIYEQNCLLKLVVKHFLMQMHLKVKKRDFDVQLMCAFNPLNVLAEKLE
jgi:hypothetical protein